MLKIFIGTLILTFLLYNRLLFVRLPKELYSSFSFIQVILFSCILLGFIISLSYNIYKFYILYNNLEPRQPSKYILYLQEHPWNPSNIWVDSLMSLDRIIKNNAPRYNHLMSYSDFIIISIIKGINSYPNATKIILLILRIIPQAIVCLTFCYDVLIAHYFYYFYKSVWLLILPMIVTYVLYTVNIQTLGNLKNLNTFIHLYLFKEEDINTDDIDLEKGILISAETWAEMQTYYKSGPISSCIYTLASDKSTGNAAHDKLIYKQCIYYLRIFMDSYTYRQQYNVYKDVIETPFNIIKFTLYIISWTYILIYGSGIL